MQDAQNTDPPRWIFALRSGLGLPSPVGVVQWGNGGRGGGKHFIPFFFYTRLECTRAHLFPLYCRKVTDARGRDASGCGNEGGARSRAAFGTEVLRLYMFSVSSVKRTKHLKLSRWKSGGARCVRNAARLPFPWGGDTSRDAYMVGTTARRWFQR